MDSIQFIIAIFTACMASSGLWAYIQKRSEKSDVRTQMLQGLAHDRIVYLASQYLRRGFVTQEEYENLHKYLYTPYVKIGGNGLCTKLMTDVDKLPVKPFTIKED